MDQHEALLRNVEALQEQLDNHQRLLRDRNCMDDRCLGFCPHLQCPHERRLREAVKDVVETLEETRHSFKSKQLEKLRRRMMEYLHSLPR